MRTQRAIPLNSVSGGTPTEKGYPYYLEEDKSLSEFTWSSALESVGSYVVSTDEYSVTMNSLSNGNLGMDVMSVTIPYAEREGCFDPKMSLRTSVDDELELYVPTVEFMFRQSSLNSITLESLEGPVMTLQRDHFHIIMFPVTNLTKINMN